MRKPAFPVMMFAAGFGSRMKHLTEHQPKPMIPVAGMPLVDHALALAQDASCQPIVANLHYLPEMLQAHLAPQGVQCIVETPDILETGGGLRNALPQLGTGPVVTMNTDAIWAGANPLRALINAWDPIRMDALLMTVPLAHAIGHNGTGDFLIGDQGQLTRGPGAVYGGIQIIKTNRLTAIQEQSFSLNVLWNEMLTDGRMYGLSYAGKWCDVGHPQGIVLAEQMLANANV